MKRLWQGFQFGPEQVGLRDPRFPGLGPIGWSLVLLDAALTLAVLATAFSPRPLPTLAVALSIGAIPFLYVRSRLALARSGTPTHLEVRSIRRVRLPIWPLLAAQFVVQTLSLNLVGPNTRAGFVESALLVAAVLPAWFLVRALLNTRGLPILQPVLFIVDTGEPDRRERGIGEVRSGTEEIFLISSRKDIAEGELRLHYPLGGGVALDRPE